MENSKHFANRLKLYLSSNKLKYRKTIEMLKLDSEQTKKSGKDRCETLGDEETEDNNNNAIFSSKSMRTEGTVPTDDESPISNMLRIPADNELALHWLHYNITKLLISSNNVIQYQHPANTNKQVRFLMINEGISLSSQKKQVKTIANAVSEVIKWR